MCVFFFSSYSSRLWLVRFVAANANTPTIPPPMTCTHLHQDQMELTCSYTICRKNSPTPIWHRHSCRSEMLSQQKCLSTSKPICQSALVLYRSIIMSQRLQPSKPCTDFKLAPRGWRCNWRSQKMPRSLIRLTHILYAPFEPPPPHTKSTTPPKTHLIWTKIRNISPTEIYWKRTKLVIIYKKIYEKDWKKKNRN